MPTAIGSVYRSCRENGGSITGDGGQNNKNSSENRREQTTRVAADTGKRLVAGEHRKRKNTTQTTELPRQDCSNRLSSGNRCENAASGRDDGGDELASARALKCPTTR